MMEDVKFIKPADEVRKSFARWLLQIDAVRIADSNQLFTLTSGRKSPVYADCRRLIGNVEARRAFIQHAAKLLGNDGSRYDVIAGGETAGIPFAAWLTEAMNLPMIYVRKRPKGFGANKRIEGILKPNQNVLLVEDMATDGGSKIGFSEAIRDVGAFCNHVLVMFYYGESSLRKRAFTENNLSLSYLCCWEDVLQVLEEQGSWKAEDIKRVREFLDGVDVKTDS